MSVVIGRVRRDRQRQSVAIHYRHDFHAFSALGRAVLRPGRGKHGIDVALRLVPARPARATDSQAPATLHRLLVRILQFGQNRE